MTRNHTTAGPVTDASQSWACRQCGAAYFGAPPDDRLCPDCASHGWPCQGGYWLDGDWTCRQCGIACFGAPAPGGLCPDCQPAGGSK